MALHGKQSKTKRQIQQHHTKPSRQARLDKRTATRQKILAAGGEAAAALRAKLDGYAQP